MTIVSDLWKVATVNRYSIFVILKVATSVLKQVNMNQCTVSYTLKVATLNQYTVSSMFKGDTLNWYNVCYLMKLATLKW